MDAKRSIPNFANQSLLGIGQEIWGTKKISTKIGMDFGAGICDTAITIQAIAITVRNISTAVPDIAVAVWNIPNTIQNTAMAAQNTAVQDTAAAA
ncbi:hypothetical protein SUNI508_13761 [Seiridium unicorne]|uniref:Uncharacterized protein n=1 Tax=Seiridium unicorne TaxID=138068 RepID=A0ABR2VBN3_9PEZI